MKKINVGILTSSRADYGIYKPLLTLLSEVEEIDVHLITFGMHLMMKFGHTVDAVINDNFGHIHRVEGMSDDDDRRNIVQSYGQIVSNFSEFWGDNSFDLVFALGDRFEMSAAVQSSIPFELHIAHLHGGETTLGAVDNIYRHQITLASRWHFVATEEAKKRVTELLGADKNVFNVGALSLDGLEGLQLPVWAKVAEQFGIPKVPFALITVHPETVNADQNRRNAIELEKALKILSEDLYLVITLTNADAMGSYYRDMAQRLYAFSNDRLTLVENFGRENYFSAMTASVLLIGNTSSGILEAASFKKFVINIGDRQKGRQQSDNVLNVPFDHEKIIGAFGSIKENPVFHGKNIYYQPGTSLKIYEVLQNEDF